MTIDDRHPVDDAFDDLLTLREVAQVLRVPEATLRYWIHKETGPTNLKIGRHIRYPRAALQRWMRDSARGGSAPRRRLTVEVMSDNTDGVLIRFTQSARRHHIGRGSYVMSWQ
jgi:excisionase family DNA binding protein